MAGVDMKDESTVQQEIQIKAMHHGCTLMRNNRGAATDETGRLIRYGLGHVGPKDKYKSVDLIGITKVVITPDMVGKTLGVFTAIEVKKEDWKFTKVFDEHEQLQKNFLDWVTYNGGIAGFANSVDSLEDIFRK
jgi:hypothetical protein